MIKSKVILVTGFGGFVGKHLAKILSVDHTIIGVGKSKVISNNINESTISYLSHDLTAGWPAYIQDVDSVVHLAGLAAVGPSFDNPQNYINKNSSMITNMCEHYLKQEKKPRIIIVSSGAVYDSHQIMPISENGKISISSPYVISKLLIENQAAYYRTRGLECIVVRPFNHFGPGQESGFILPDFYKRILETTDNGIKVGNIATKRDYTDVRDIVNAYKLLIEAPSLSSSIYNVSSGNSVSGEDILNKLKKRMDKPNLVFEIDQLLTRPTDAPDIIGDSSLIQKEVGWKPSISVDQTIDDFVQSHQ